MIETSYNTLRKDFAIEMRKDNEIHDHFSALHAKDIRSNRIPGWAKTIDPQITTILPQNLDEWYKS